MAIPLPSEASCISKANFSEKVPLFEDLAEDTNHFRANANCFSFFKGKGQIKEQWVRFLKYVKRMTGRA